MEGQAIEVTSSDGDHDIGTVTDNSDGTYTATITSSVTAGSATITASNGSVSPALPATATLTQTAGPATDVALALSPSSIVANGTSTSTATATVTDAHGNTVSGDTVAITIPGRSIPAAVPGPTPGTYQATITSTTAAGEFTVTATDSSVTPAETNTETLTQTAGPATDVDVSLSPDSIIANGTSTTTATATVTDAQGNPISGHTVSFAVDGESAGPTTPGTAAGTYQATVTSSTTVADVTVTATDSSVTPAIDGHATLTQTRGPASSISLALEPSSIVANGSSTSVATATVTDAQGHPASGDDVTIGATGGDTVTSTTPGSAPGRYEATITSTTTVGTRTITATDSSVSPSETQTATLTQRSLTDPEPPTATIITPADDQTYNLNQVVATSFSCADSPGSTDVVPGPGIDTCRDSNNHTSPGSLATAVAGVHTYTVTATSENGQQDTDTISYRVLGPPTATISSPAGGATYARDQVVATSFSCADAAGAPGISSCVDSRGDSTSPGSLDTSTLGPHTYSVTATSSDGQTFTRTIAYTVAAPPTATISAPEDDELFAVGQTVPTQFSCAEGESGPGLQSCVDSRGDASSPGALDTTQTGTHSYTVTATSQDGQTATKTISYTVAAGPTATITAPANNRTFRVGESVPTSFSCAEGTSGPGLASCTDSDGAPAPGGTIDTATTGTRTYSVTATSQSGRTFTRTITYTVAAAPTATISAPANNQTYAVGQNVPTSFACAEGASGPGIQSCADSRGDSSSPGALNTATTGQHTYTVTATSQDGQTATGTISYTVAAAPSATITTPANNRTFRVGQSVPTTFSCAEGAAGPGLSSCTDSNGSPAPGGTIDTSTTGTRTYTVTASSHSGQTATRTITYTVAAAPTATITAPTNNQTYAVGQNVPTSFACAEGASGPGMQSCTDSEGDSSSPGTLDTAQTGQHTYTVTATSQDGQTATKTISYTVAAAPTATITAPGNNGAYRAGQTVTTAFSCADGASGPGIDTCTDSRGNAAPSGTLDTTTPGSKTYTVTARSKSGQTATRTITYTVSGPPTATVDSPAGGRYYAHNETVPTSFSCTEGPSGPGLETCLDSHGSASPGKLDTSKTGPQTYTVTATSKSNAASTAIRHYDVAAAPTSSIAGFQSGQWIRAGSHVDFSVTCTDGEGGPGIESCTDDAGSRSLDTRQLGAHAFTVVARSGSGQSSSSRFVYHVAADPTAEITSPAAAATAADPLRLTYLQDAPVRFSCTDPGGPGLQSCTGGDGDRPPAGKIDTSRVGAGVYSVRALSGSGFDATDALHYDVSYADLRGQFDADPGVPQVEERVKFTGSATGGRGPYAYAWDTGDGFKDGERTLTTKFERVGNANVRLRVTDARNETFISERSIRVEKACKRVLNIDGAAEARADCFEPVPGSSPKRYTTNGAVEINRVRFTGGATVTEGERIAFDDAALALCLDAKPAPSGTCADRWTIKLGTVKLDDQGVSLRSNGDTQGAVHFFDVPATTRFKDMPIYSRVYLQFGRKSTGARNAYVGTTVQLPVRITTQPTRSAVEGTLTAPEVVDGAGTPLSTPIALLVEPDGVRYDSTWTFSGAKGTSLRADEAYVGGIRLKDVCFAYAPQGAPRYGCPEPQPGRTGGQTEYTSGPCTQALSGAVPASTPRWRGGARIMLPKTPAGDAFQMFGSVAGGRLTGLGATQTGFALGGGVDLGTVSAELCPEATTAELAKGKAPITVRASAAKAELGSLRLGETAFEYADAHDRTYPASVPCAVVPCPKSIPWTAMLSTTRGIDMLGAKLNGNAKATLNASSQVDFTSSTKSSFGPFSVDANLSGWVDGRTRTFSASGGGGAHVSGIGGFGADIGMSSKGMAACGGFSISFGLLGSISWHAGAGVYWKPFAVNVMWRSCGLGDYIQAKPAPSLATRGGVKARKSQAAAAGHIVTVAPKQRLFAVRATGKDAPPKLVLTPPDGSTPITSPVSETSATVTGRYYLAENAADKSTSVQVIGPVAGDWKIASAEPAHPVVTVESAKYQPPPTAKGTVSKPARGGKPERVLTLRYAKRDSDRMLLTERGDNLGRTITEDLKGKPCDGKADADGVIAMCATVPFTPTFGPGGVRRIEAVVTAEDGLPVKTLVAAEFRVPPPAKPGKPKSLRITRMSNNRVFVAWSPSSNAAGYTLGFRLSDGRMLGETNGSRCRAVILRNVGRTVAVSVEVRGMRQDLVAGPPATLRLPAKKKAAGVKRAPAGAKAC